MEERRECERARVLHKFHTKLCYALQGADLTVIARKLLEKDVISKELYTELEDILARVAVVLTGVTVKPPNARLNITAVKEKPLKGNRSCARFCVSSLADFPHLKKTSMGLSK